MSQETHDLTATKSSRLIVCKVWGIRGGAYKESHLLLRGTMWIFGSKQTHTEPYPRRRHSSERIILCRPEYFQLYLAVITSLCRPLKSAIFRTMFVFTSDVKINTIILEFVMITSTSLKNKYYGINFLPKWLVVASPLQRASVASYS
jgi:hypothetical protein